MIAPYKKVPSTFYHVVLHIKKEKYSAFNINIHPGNKSWIVGVDIVQLSNPGHPPESYSTTTDADVHASSDRYASSHNYKDSHSQGN